jgi:SAM-dependent methyltransferase
MFKPSPAMFIRTQRRAKMIFQEFDLKNDLDVLEIGCGTGELAAHLSKLTSSNILSTDLDEEFVKIASEKHTGIHNLFFATLDFNNPEKLKGKKFDYIVGNGILHHLYFNLDFALSKLKELLNPGGKIIFIEPNIYNPYCFFIFKIPYFRRLASLEPSEMAFSKNFIFKKLNFTNFNEINIKFKDFLLPNTPKPLILPLIILGYIFEKLPFFRLLSQSIVIVAKN